MTKSNQRITKIKRDPIEELLKRAEATPVEDAVIINEPGSNLVPYPTTSELYVWMRDYLLKGINCIYNNYIDDNGETYFTTIVDGLVLMTKQTKAIGQAPLIETPISFPQLSQNGTIGGDDYACSFNPSGAITGGQPYQATTGQLSFKFKPNAKLPEYDETGYFAELILYSPVAIKPTGIQFSFFTAYGGKQEKANMSKYIQLSASNNGSTWQVLAELDMEPYIGQYQQEIQAALAAQFASSNTFYKYFKMKFKDPFSKAVGVARFNPSGVYLAPGDINSSKPGLWLSNLLSPYTQSSAGSWLRQNLIPDNHNEFNQLNTDTIGNYSYSFLNNGIIYRQAGSTHEGQDSYIQHWSPSLMGSMSYEGMIIPKGLNQTFLFQSSYTNYQTLAVPNNPDMQRYTTTDSKEVTYQFVDNTNSNPPAITTFNGRFVGKDWSYELEFKQNNSGSCMNYDPETGDCPSHENQSNGGCVTGKIIYTAGQGTPCEVQIDECFNTYQSIANPQVPVVPNLGTTVKPLETPANQNNWIFSNWFGLTCCTYNIDCTNPPGYGTYVVSATTNAGSLFMLDATTNEYIETNKHNNVRLDYSYSASATCGIQGLSGMYADSEGCSSYCRQSCRNGNMYFCLVDELSGEEEGIDIYFNIKDIKEEYIINDLPWDYDCTVTRFETWFSTEPSSDIGVSSILIASNVDINSLGDISMLTDKTL